MDALDSHMMLGRDFAAITAFKAIRHSLVDAGCTHLSSLTIKESSYYWRSPSEAKALGKRFFEEFWHAGGNEMAIMQGACSRGQVPWLPPFRSAVLFERSSPFAF
jgi:chemotaxis methyl-accepting protein methylase